MVEYRTKRLQSLNNLLVSKLRRFEAYAGREHRVIGAAVLRIMLGMNVLLMQTLHLQQREFIWGDHGVLPIAWSSTFLSVTGLPSLYNVGDETFHAALYCIGIFVSALFVVGVYSRAVSIVFYIMTMSLFARNTVLLDGGDNLLELIAFWMMFLNLSGRETTGSVGSSPKRRGALTALLHNLAIVAIVGQVSLVYFTSAWSKMMGHKWQDGTAIYYILRTSEFNLSPIASFIYHNDYLVTLLTYGTLVLQIGFPFVIWHRTLKYPWILGACAFHLAIGYFMGLIWFSFTLISCEFILISDSAYLAAARLTRFLWTAGRSWAHERSESAAVGR